MSAVKLRDFLLVLRTRWLIVLGVTLVVTGIAAAYTYTATPVYTAQATFYLAAEADSGKNTNPIIVTIDDLNTYVAVLGSPAVMEPLRETLDLPPGTPIDVSAEVTETNLLQVTAHSVRTRSSRLTSPTRSGRSWPAWRPSSTCCCGPRDRRSSPER